MPEAESVDAQLLDLQRQSEQRTAELKALAAQMPAMLGRRAMLRTLVGDGVANTNKRELVRRGSNKVRRLPMQLIHAARHRSRPPSR